MKKSTRNVRNLNMLKMKLRDYQNDIKNQGLKILLNHRILYLSMEVRTGKTLTSLSICNELGVNNVLFITKKKAIPSIIDDYEKLNVSWNFWCINYESLHKLPEIEWDVIEKNIWCRWIRVEVLRC